MRDFARPLFTGHISASSTRTKRRCLTHGLCAAVADVFSPDFMLAFAWCAMYYSNGTHNSPCLRRPLPIIIIASLSRRHSTYVHLYTLHAVRNINRIIACCVVALPKEQVGYFKNTCARWWPQSQTRAAYISRNLEC